VCVNDLLLKQLEQESGLVHFQKVHACDNRPLTPAWHDEATFYIVFLLFSSEVCQLVFTCVLVCCMYVCNVFGRKVESK